MSTRIALVVANASDSDAGYVGERLEQRGYTGRMVFRDKTRLPSTLEGVDLLLLLGSEWSVHEPHDAGAVEAETMLVRGALDAGVPVLAICYGAQLLTHALGGAVRRAAVPEAGWVVVDSTRPSLVPPGPWLEFHTDVCAPPPDATVIATNSVGVQAFAVPGALAVQFHPEVRPSTLEGWLQRSPDIARASGVDPKDLVAESERREPAARERAYELVDVFLDQFVPTHTSTPEGASSKP